MSKNWNTRIMNGSLAVAGLGVFLVAFGLNRDNWDLITAASLLMAFGMIGAIFSSAQKGIMVLWSLVAIAMSALLSQSTPAFFGSILLFLVGVVSLPIKLGVYLWNNPSVAKTILLILCGVVLPFTIPAIVAYKRRHRDRMAITMLSLLIITSPVALIWSLTGNVEDDPRVPHSLPQ